MSQFPNKLCEFGAFRLDIAERALWRGDERFALPLKVFDTLLTLIEKQGRVVSKSELMQAVWGDAFVEESNLSQNIYTLRRTLGVDEQGRQFIETVPRRGYRFTAPVTFVKDPTDVGKLTEGGVPQEVSTTAIGESREAFVSASSIPSTDRLPAPAASPPQPVSPSAHAKPSLRNALWAGLGVLILSALGFWMYQLITGRGDKHETDIAPIEQLRFQRLTDNGDVVFPTISPNGDLLAYVRHGEQEESVWVRQIETGSAVQTLPPSREGYRSLAFSPDGKFLFFREETDPGDIYQTSPFGGVLKKVAENVWSDFSVSPDGRQFAFVRRDAARNTHLVILSNVDGSGERELSARQMPLDYRNAPAWSPDSTRIVIGAGLQGQFFPSLLTVDVATGQETELKIPNWRAITRAIWMPSGKHLIVAAREGNEPSSQLWMLAYPDGDIRRLTNDLEAYFWLSLSSDGRMLVTRQQRIVTRLWLMPNGDMKGAKQLTFGERTLDGYVGLAWTPDGRIVFSSFAGHNTDLYLINADGGNRIQLTSNAGQDNTHPSVSPDGRYIVFTSNRTGTRQIWRMNIDGRNQKQLTFGDGQSDIAQFAALSTDGADVFYLRHGGQPAAIWRVSIEGGTPIQVSRLTSATTESLLSISPDGKWLASRHVSAQPEGTGEERRLRISILPTEGGAEPKLFDLPIGRTIIQWSADSTAFDYAGGPFNSSSLWRQPLAGGEPQKLCEFPDRIFDLAWSRDKKNLVVSRGRQQGDAILITNLP
jgi:Tol biopolymer transport system component/DNA-binding winged helix-turn-helix (wHTH) protein